MCYFIEDISFLSKDPLASCWSAEKLGGEKQIDVVRFIAWSTIAGCRKSSLSGKASMEN